MIERNEAAFEFLVAHEQFAEAIEPTVADLDDPAPSLPGGIAPLGIGLAAPVHDVRDVAMFLDDAQVLGAAVAGI